MPDVLPVRINREEVHAVEAASSFEADETFLVRLENHGSPTHVHLHLDGAVGDAAALGATNHYVEEGESLSVEVTVDQDRLPARGSLEVMTGYGAESTAVDLSLVKREVIVDQSLEDPAPPDPEPLTDALLEAAPRDVLPVVALGAVALLIAAGVAVAVPDPLTAAVGVLAVFAGLGAAVFLLVRDG